MATSPARRTRVPRPVRAVLVATALVVGAFVVTTVPGVRRGAGFDGLADGWLQGAAYGLCAGLALLRPVLVAEQRWSWGLLGGSVVLRALGFVLFLGVVRVSSPVPYPSVADAAWVASGVGLLLTLAARLRLRSVSLLVVLDALIGALTVTGLTLALLYDALVAMSRPGTPARQVATNLAYPVLDVAVLVLAVGVLAGQSWRPRREDAVLVAGLVGFAVVDVAYLYLSSAGLYRPGTPVAALSLVATAVLAASGWVGGGAPARGREPDVVRPAGIGVPLGFAVLCVGALVVASYEGGSGAWVAPLVVALAATALRGVLTLRGTERVAGRAVAATQEELLRFQALVEASADFIAIAGVDGRVLYLNPAGRRMVGLPADVDVTGTRVVDYLTEEGVEASLTVEQPAVVQQGSWQGESTLRDRRGGPPIPVAINSFLMRDPGSGEPFALATVQRDISQRLRAEQSARELAESRQTLVGRLVQAQEDERARIAADVHDDSVQALAVVQLRLALLARQLDGTLGEAQRSGLRELQESVEGATVRLRDLLFDLDSPARRAGLAEALEEASSHVLDVTGVSWRLVGDRAVDLPLAARVTAYRVVQEALVNVRRHARATSVVVELARTADPGGVAVSVTDDGCGLAGADLDPRPGHLGLSSMRDRALVAGGHVELAEISSGGTRLSLWLPDPVTPQ